MESSYLCSDIEEEKPMRARSKKKSKKKKVKMNSKVGKALKTKKKYKKKETIPAYGRRSWSGSAIEAWNETRDADVSNTTLVYFVCQSVERLVLILEVVCSDLIVN